MLAFAANSVLNRLALADTAIDAASFTLIRLAAGALVLWALVRRQSGSRLAGDWPGACALFVYAAAFSFAYRALPTGTGALLLFGTVQVSMIAAGLFKGERFRPLQIAGFVVALAGLAVLLAPGVSAPPVDAALLMMLAGLAWGVYSLRGRHARATPLAMTAGNFVRAVPLAIGLSMVSAADARIDLAGAGYAMLSGALASGVGYAIWYSALRGLTATQAATVQLSVPVIAALGGALLLAEPLTARLALASAATLGGIALVVTSRR
ncbi:DMT family transporter [Methyloversatilis sp.]|uniref:DMT family transporter n=1 Tax=Methyloversatilis sp. TaxID=2569862 RepID=UPI0035237D83